MGKLNTIKTKQLAVFLLMITFLLLLSGILFRSMSRFAVEIIYRQMESQAEYYVNSVENQMEEIMRQQSDFFVDRQLVFLADEKLLDDYGRRNALLSVQEKLFIMISSNELLKDAILYIPGSGYVINSTQIRELGEADVERLEGMKARLGRLVLEGESLLYALAETPYAETVTPNFYLQTEFDQGQLLERLDSFILQEGGACWHCPELEWFLESTSGPGIGRRIVESVQCGEGIEEVYVDGTSYLVNVTQSGYFGRLVQYDSRRTVLKGTERYTVVFSGLMLLAVGFAVLFSRYTERLVNRPLRKLQEAFQELEKGDLEIRISHSVKDEFEYIYQGFNHMVEKLARTIEDVYVQKNLAAQAELKQLQAQISPHFLYNSFFLFSGRVRRGDFGGARELADYLGTYFRYLTRNARDIVTLADEMEHAEAYARIQESRFASRMELIWEPLPEEAAAVLVPRLIIQPLLENSYKYGLENREEDGVLRVSFRLETGWLVIGIENNGDVTEEEIKAIQERFSDGYAGEVTGMVNIHRRLRNYFRNRSGLKAARGELGGVLITMALPLEEGEEDVPAIDR